MGQITRVTMFKLPTVDDRKAALQAYDKLEKAQKKDGKPYILSINAYELYDDPRSQGFTLLAKTTFASLDDMEYYDDGCEAHQALKDKVGPLAQGVMTVYMDS